MLAEAPPATEKNEAFLAVRELLAGAGVKVPALYAADLERGFLLLEDLGDSCCCRRSEPRRSMRHYHAACECWSRWRAGMTGTGCRAMTEPACARSWAAFRTGLCKLCWVTAPDAARAPCSRGFSLLIDSALEQPRVLVHRDFHSRNLMLAGRWAAGGD